MPINFHKSAIILIIRIIFIFIHESIDENALFLRLMLFFRFHMNGRRFHEVSIL